MKIMIEASVYNKYKDIVIAIDDDALYIEWWMPLPKAPEVK